MRTSVVIVSYNTRSALLRCLSTVTGAWQVCVVDNASTDGTVDAVRAAFPHVQVLALPTNYGFSVAVNRGAAAVNGDALLLLNPDTELPHGGMARMAACLAQRPGAAGVGFRQVDAQGRFQLAMGPRPTIANEGVRCFVQRQLDRNHRWVGWCVDHLFAQPRAVPWVAASSLLVRRQAFDRVGGFDERFFLYFEDIDFCLRVGAVVGPIYYDPSVTLLHHRGLSAATAPDFAAKAYRASQLYFWGKHRGPWMRRAMGLYVRARTLATS